MWLSLNKNTVHLIQYAIQIIELLVTGLIEVNSIFNVIKII